MKHCPDKNDDRERRLFNLKTAFDQKLDSITKEGSKREARVALTNELRDIARAAGMTEEEAEKIRAKNSDGLHWEDTIKQYRNTCHRFCDWVVDAHPEARNLNYIRNKKYPAEWLEKTYDNVKSRKTIRSHIAKVLDVPGEKLLKIDKITGAASLSTKGRDFDPIKSPIADAKKYGEDLPIFSRSTGGRLSELPHITPSCFRYKEDGRLYCHYNGKLQHTKGGRDRDSRVPLKYEQAILKMMEGKKPDEPIIPKVPQCFNAHAYRRLYSAELDLENARDFDSIRNLRSPIKPKHDYDRGTVREDAPTLLKSTLRNREFDRDSLADISGNLGHGDHRVDLVVKNYSDYFGLI